MQFNSYQRFGISKRTAIVLFVAPFIGLSLLVAARFLSEGLWRRIDEEDGPIEWFQFAGLALSCCLSLAIAVHLVKQRQRFASCLYALLGLGLLFVAGEEIAWGQRVLQFATPEALAAINEKQEVSVHNVESLSDLFNLGKFAAGLYGVLGCWIMAWLAERRDVQTLELFVVPWFLSSAFLVILVQRVLRWTLLQDSVPRGFGEFDESCFVFGITAFVALTWRRLRRPQTI